MDPNIQTTLLRLNFEDGPQLGLEFLFRSEAEGSDGGFQYPSFAFELHNDNS